MANFLAEVDEALKQERAEKLWKEYGGLIIGTIALIILGTAALSGYRVWNKNVQTAQTEKFLDAADANTPETLTQIAESLRPGLKSLSLWRAAGASLEQNKKPEALALYNKILTDSQTPTDIKHLAAYQVARLTAQDDPQTGLNLLEKRANDMNNPWNLLARLDVAVLQAHYKGNMQLARDHLATILKETDLPKSLERKARSLDMLYALQAPNTTPGNREPLEKQAPGNNTVPTDQKIEAPQKKEGKQ